MQEHLLVIYPDGTVAGLWADDMPWHEIGTIRAAPRLSQVEFDPHSQQWVARDLRTGRVIASARSRAATLALEAQHYSALLAEGLLKPPEEVA